MSEKGKEEGGKKKGGKLPIIIAAVAILGGGGFFMTKKGDGKKKEEPKLKIAAEVVELGEMLVNLTGGNDSYARINVGLQFVDGYDTHGLDKGKAAVRDAIIGVVSQKTKAVLATSEGKNNLKVEIAAAVNHALHALHPAEEKKEEKKDEEDKKEKDSHGEDHSGGHGAKDEKRKYPEWDSDEGPVLKVHFSDFIMQ